MTSSKIPNLPDDQLPDAIVSGLQQSETVPFAIPTDLEKQILRDAHEFLELRPPVRPARRWFRLVAAASSICAALLVFTVTRWTDGTDQASETQIAPSKTATIEIAQPAWNPHDIDRNGTVDIMDAYAMARRLQADDLDQGWDFNRDGQLNELDIQLVAFDAVML